MTEWLTKSASDLGRAIGAGQVDPVDLTEASLQAAQAHPLTSRIYARMTPDRARAEALAAAERAKSGARAGLLDGVPLSWKDLFDSAGTATEAGSALLKDRVPDRDALVLNRATHAGSVCLGKTHMSELAFSGLGLNPVTATPPCVNDPDAVSGGSSSGAAASVAFGLAPAAIGSDTGGSVRIPAAWNDLVGLKTTSGDLPLTGVVPLCARFDTAGPLTRTVEDAAEVYALLKGEPAADLGGADLRSARLLSLDGIATADLRPEPASGFESARARLAQAGAKIDHANLKIVNQALDLSGVLFATEAYGTWKTRIEAAPHLMFGEILNRFRSGSTASAADYVAAWQELDRLRVAYRAATESYDAVILPTSPILPPKLDRLMNDGEYYVTENLLALRNTRIGNLFGLCAVTLPTGIPSCGIMLLGAPGQERHLLRLASAAERALE